MYNKLQQLKHGLELEDAEHADTEDDEFPEDEGQVARLPDVLPGPGLQDLPDVGPEALELRGRAQVMACEAVREHLQSPKPGDWPVGVMTPVLLIFCSTLQRDPFIKLQSCVGSYAAKGAMP